MSHSTDVISTPQPIALCNGHFHVLHADHIRLFEAASQLGRVIVAINSDYHHYIKYGNKAVASQDRLYTIKSCKYVDSVIVFDEATPSELIRKIRPHYLVKGPDYRGLILPEQQACDEVGCEIVIRDGDRLMSSSELA